jgi:hypothetical protein
VRFGGFCKEDVMQYIEALEQQIHQKNQKLENLNQSLRKARKELLHWIAAARLEHRRGKAAQRVGRALGTFQQELVAAQALAEEIEQENRFLRERIRVLEEDPQVEPPSVPLEQLTFRLFIDGLEDE